MHEALATARTLSGQPVNVAVARVAEAAKELVSRRIAVLAARTAELRAEAAAEALASAVFPHGPTGPAN